MADLMWDTVVGIPIDDWRRADTPEQLRWLSWLRDNPMPEPPCVCSTVDILDMTSKLVRAGLISSVSQLCPRHH